MRKNVLLSLIILSAFFSAASFYLSWYFLLVAIPFVLILVGAIYDSNFSRHSIVRNFPVIGRSRFIAEWLRPKIYQYFVEPDYDGRPFNRLDRNIIYQRAKNINDTTPFGTQLNTYEAGYEWMSHSIVPKDPHSLDQSPRVMIGGTDCSKPYSCSLLNVSAMSFGSLSGAAVEALNAGAAMGGFAHNTGEGGIAPQHLKYGGDLIYQIGTGYFGCRDKDGNFDAELFKMRTTDERIKMIEIKLSQGAKPGHGGILPGKKATPEIAKIRNIEPYKDVLSPTFHTAFTTPIELLFFIRDCRKLSGGKPVGIKLCVGIKSEFIAICKAMIESGIRPDFIAVDGGEGGTGAAPLEFSNSVGLPFKEGLTFVYDTLIGFNLKKEITLIGSGKISTGFHMFRAFAMGADVCNSARAMMMSIGCIQALECNLNTCPTGVATQDPSLVKGLMVSDKKVRVHQYHKATIKSFVELLAAAGLNQADQLNRRHVSRRVSMANVLQYDQIYPYITEGCLLKRESVPHHWLSDWSTAVSISFQPAFEQVYINED